MITDKLGISKGSVQTILKEDLNMWKLCISWELVKVVCKQF
jgi:hypothetical protein